MELLSMLFSWSTFIGIICGAAGITPVILKYMHDETASPEAHLKLIADIRERVTNYILTKDSITFNAIAKQKKILNAQGRDTVAIFLDTGHSAQILSNILETSTYVEEVIDSIKILGVPVAHIGDIPVYVSDLLKDAPVFVAGGIKWQLDN